MAHAQADLDTFVSDGVLFSSATPCDRNGQSSPLHRIPQCDLIAFIAIAQSVDVSFVDIAWHQGLGSAGRGASANVRQALANASTSLAFKQLTQIDDESQMYKTALSEILVLQHPSIRADENILDLYGIGWDVHRIDGIADHQLIPVLVYENASRYGNLRSFMWNMRPPINDVIGASSPVEGPLHFIERLKICEGIGKAIETMHTCNVIHGDLKPENILIFPGQDDRNYVPKIIDFGYSTYGFNDSDLVKIACTREWMAPEWHHRAFQIRSAKKIDIYCFAKVCKWILFDADIGHGTWRGMDRGEAGPHMNQFYEYGLCEDPQKRASSISVLLSILRKARRAESGSFFHDLLRMNPSGFESNLHNHLGQEEGVKMMQVVTMGAQRYSSDAKNLFEESSLEPKNTLNLLSKELPQVVDIAKNFFDFQSLHFIIRVKIRERLLELSKDKRQSRDRLKEIAFQLALCYELAFGHSRDVNESQKWLLVSGHDKIRLSVELDKLSSRTQDGIMIQALLDDSKAVPRGDFYQAAGLLDVATEILRVEFEGKLASLGPHALVTLTLQKDFAESLVAQGRHDAALELLTQMLDASEEEAASYAFWHTALHLDISQIYAEQGDYVRAISMCEHLLQTESTSAIMFALSGYYGNICEYERSAQWMEQVWEYRKEKFGDKHPFTMAALELLSYAMTDVNLGEAARMETEVLDWRRKVMGESHAYVIQTLENLALVKSCIKATKTQAIEMQREVLSRRVQSIGSSWSQTVISTNRLMFLQWRAEQVDEAIKTGEEILEQKEELLNHSRGLALLGNHAGNLKAVGRDTEAENLREEILQKIPLVLKPIPRLSNDVIRGVARAFLIEGQFDKEASALYVKIWELSKKRREELGEHDERAVMISRFTSLLYSEGHIVQSTIHILGLEHTTTNLAIVRMENRLSSFVKGDTEMEACISEAIEWIKGRIASLKTTEI